MDRRQFLKTSLAALAAFVVARLLSRIPGQQEKKTGITEALFYRRSDDLAG